MIEFTKKKKKSYGFLMLFYARGSIATIEKSLAVTSHFIFQRLLLMDSFSHQSIKFSHQHAHSMLENKTI